IRKNTLFLYAVLLGASEPHLITNNQSVLGLLNRTYDNLFYVLDKDKSDSYKVKLDGKVYSDLRKIPRKCGRTFDNNGLITNTITFTSNNLDSALKIEISRTQIPSNIWAIDKAGKSRQLWPIS
ncbi:MAG: hypothetical protein Q3987_09305, partial [Oscillospiraceae bacterium]|nr:hypothetical protein [Oscillospiraceae bacterium]